MKQAWKISSGSLPFGERTLVMGVLNVTPDSFSDGGEFLSVDKATVRAEEMVQEGADVIDIGGESTRPGAVVVSAEEEIQRVVPVIEELTARIKVPLSIDTTKPLVAAAALNAGVAIVNDVSGLRFDEHIADVAATAKAGLILMHSRGLPGAMHGLPTVENIMEVVTKDLRHSISIAEARGVDRESIVIDPGIGFGKTQEQNLELIAKLDQLMNNFPGFPLLIGTSRKSFLGRILNGAPSSERLFGTMATVTAAILNGAHIIRVHDVKASVETARVAEAIKANG